MRRALELGAKKKHFEAKSYDLIIQKVTLRVQGKESSWAGSTSEEPKKRRIGKENGKERKKKSAFPK